MSVFERLGPLPPRNKHAESARVEDLEELVDDDEENKYHRPRWCPDGLSRSQKRRVQRLRGLEEAERLYLGTLRKARPDLAAKIRRAWMKRVGHKEKSGAPSRGKPMMIHRLAQIWSSFFQRSLALQDYMKHLWRN